MDYSQIVTVGLVLFSATVVVRVAGFGGSLVAMPLLVPILGLSVASPLMNLFGATNFAIVIFQRWRELTFRDMWRITLMTVLVMPFGIYLVFIVPESILRLILGLTAVGYAIFRLVGFVMPPLIAPRWAWIYGAVAGLYSGAFNVGGVITILYADSQDWEPDRFRLNMFSYFLATSIFGLISRYIAGQLTQSVVLVWLGAVPFLLAGLAVGSFLTRFVNRERFKLLVLMLLIVLGGRLIWSIF